MNGDDLQTRYCGFMSEIKTRLQSIYDMMEADNSKVPFVIMLESCYLQLRMIDLRLSENPHTQAEQQFPLINRSHLLFLINGI